MAVLLGMAIAVQCATALAKQNMPPAALERMRVAFADAVAKKDIALVEALTSFPFKNRVEHEPSVVKETEFKTIFSQNGYENMSNCLKTSSIQPAPKGNYWLINCDGNIFYFAVRNGKWLHTEYENVNE